MIDQLTSATSLLLSGSPRPKDSPEKIKKAAQEFEALLIGQMLKAAREGASCAGLGTGGDAASQTGMEMAEQQFASLMASKGGLGLSTVITADLERQGK